MRHLNQSPDNDGRTRILMEAAHKLHIQLDAIYLVIFQSTQGRHAGAKIIQSDLIAFLLHGTDGILDLGAFNDRRFCDLNTQGIVRNLIL